VKGADAAVGDAMHAVGDLVLDIAGGEHGPRGGTDLGLIEAALQAALASMQSLAYVGVHLKSLAAGVDDA
jgi:hypothetical protein